MHMKFLYFCAVILVISSDLRGQKGKDITEQYHKRLIFNFIPVAGHVCFD